MSRRQKNPLRRLTAEECQWLTRIARSTSEPASHVVRAKHLLAVADGLPNASSGTPPTPPSCRRCGRKNPVVWM